MRKLKPPAWPPLWQGLITIMAEMGAHDDAHGWARSAVNTALAIMAMEAAYG